MFVCVVDKAVLFGFLSSLRKNVGWFFENVFFSLCFVCVAVDSMEKGAAVDSVENYSVVFVSSASLP